MYITHQVHVYILHTKCHSLKMYKSEIVQCICMIWAQVRVTVTGGCYKYKYHYTLKCK